MNLSAFHCCDKIPEEIGGKDLLCTEVSVHSFLTLLLRAWGKAEHHDHRSMLQHKAAHPMADRRQKMRTKEEGTREKTYPLKAKLNCLLSTTSPNFLISSSAINSSMD
jgi:hypothetical protein